MYNGNLLRDAIISGANNIAKNKKRVDDLNVFPVPDGDTGTNMSMTVGNAARELERLDNESVSKIADTAASAMLRGARGNSGVITSLLFRGFSKGFRGADEITAENLSDAFRLGVEAAYNAVMKPTEGTILTVARVASERAAAAAGAGKDVKEVFFAALEGAREALDDTPNILEVLKKAGVVDAGGKGFVVILEGMYSVLDKGIIIEGVQTAEEPEEESDRNVAGDFDTEITFTYCTEFIVNRADEAEGQPSELRAYLETIGDCVVVVDDESIIKVHVHTDHPGKALEKGIEFGQLVHLKIENMRDQHERAKHDSESRNTKPSKNAERTETITSVAPEKPYGFVSVSAGAGLEALFRELGADVVVSGGQTMNPSTDDILRAVEATPAETVFVLPNNKNIIMAAEQAIPLATRKVIVLPTRSVPQGITAMLNFDPESDPDANAIAMQNAFSEITTGQMTFAARDSDYEGFNIKEGQLMGIINGKLALVENDIEKCLLAMVKKMVKKDSQFLTVIYGEDISESDAEALETALNLKYGSKVEISFINGGQPVYYFILSAE